MDKWKAHIARLLSGLDDMIEDDDDLATLVDALNALSDYARDRMVASVARRAGKNGTAADYEKRATVARTALRRLGLDW